MSSIESSSAVVQVILLVFINFPLVCYVLLKTVRFALARFWTDYATASTLKQDKSARNLTKAIIYLIIWCLLLPISTRLLSEWSRHGFSAYIPPISLSYVRIVASFVPPLYVFELVTMPEPSVFDWLHHAMVTIVIPFIITGTFFDSPRDSYYLLYTAALVLQATFSAFVFFAGHALARIWQDSRRKYRLLYGIFAFASCYVAVVQLFLWLRFAGNVSHLSNWKPTLMTVVVSLVIAIENGYHLCRTLSMARYVERRVKTLGNEKESCQKIDSEIDFSSADLSGADRSGASFV